jgi:hypothetical protein
MARSLQLYEANDIIVTIETAGDASPGWVEPQVKS